MSPTTCVPHVCNGHDSAHVHGPNCGHATVKHEDHVDYVVDGHRHHAHGVEPRHCDDHGKV
jgi:hypothetical protein